MRACPWKPPTPRGEGRVVRHTGGPGGVGQRPVGLAGRSSPGDGIRGPVRDRAEDMPSDKGWGTELAQQAYLEAAEAGTPVVTAESGASWCSIQAEHARGSVLYTIRAVGESGTEEQVRTSLDRVLETWLSAPEGEKHLKYVKCIQKFSDYNLEL